ncbi:unnamed protein product [Amoebophrya sp. A120]|nr:unnamed protein product [Amoebophrya sp. A120]|eukprot:GSA120T00002267001.1
MSAPQQQQRQSGKARSSSKGKGKDGRSSSKGKQQRVSNKGQPINPVSAYSLHSAPVSYMAMDNYAVPSALSQGSIVQQDLPSYLKSANSSAGRFSAANTSQMGSRPPSQQPMSGMDPMVRPPSARKSNSNPAPKKRDCCLFCGGC